MQFKWEPSGPPPPIEPHSKAKLQVLRNYLRAYFDRLGIVYARDNFKLDLVDGFAGGGTFLDGSETISGTPLIMLEEAQAAKERLARGRSKPIRFDFKFYFVDVNAAHTAHLHRAMVERGFDPNDESIIIRTGRFEDNLADILAQIKGVNLERDGRCFSSISAATPRSLFGTLGTSSQNSPQRKLYSRSLPIGLSITYTKVRRSSKPSRHWRCPTRMCGNYSNSRRATAARRWFSEPSARTSVGAPALDSIRLSSFDLPRREPCGSSICQDIRPHET